MKTVKKEGFAAMKEWNESFKGGHLPAWFKKCIRARYKKLNNEASSRDCYEYNELNGGLWDHYGSYLRDGIRVVITQPYGQHDEKAKKWADELGCELFESREGAPWHEWTWYYEFRPKG